MVIKKRKIPHRSWRVGRLEVSFSMAEATLSDTTMEPTIWGDFPEDLWFEILQRVPAKSLVKFTKVSKSWYVLITSSRFIKTHLARVQIECSKSILVRRYSKSGKQERYSVHPDNDDFILQSSELELPPASRSRDWGYLIVGTCNGLICLRGNMNGTCTKPIFVWNPSIRKWIELPLPNIDPYSKYVTLGFGCDLQQLDYKVVRYVVEEKIGGVAEVYSLNSKRWMKVPIVSSRHGYITGSSTPVLVNGIVHWLVLDGERLRIVYLGFDFKDETFSEIFLPQHITWQHLFKLWHFLHEDCLAVSECDHISSYNQFNGYCNIWVMKEYGNVESWELLFKIKLEEGIRQVIGLRQTGHCLATKGMMAVDEIVAMRPGNESKVSALVSFDPNNSGAVKDLEIVGTEFSIYALPFLGSLVLLEGRCRF
ncbi:OLC1v1022820C1 [Oldenlandia corymbosa var. corymbosa]|uniref:OLC1v1022820C1 n=1 Tax=Oldenlandia corymbosa var. corymbosa TaxID=529605 RepID=A0AAV1BYM9_OLDCO|nr:OLC1v1022820C1 [Oldenlandia corymbosa var. corymbosa]